MSQFLIHIHTGPENPTKAALGLLVALAAAKGGHGVTLFIAGDGVHLLDAGKARETTGTGTGNVAAHLADLKELGAQFFLSGMSAKARGYDEGLLTGYDAAFAMPDKLVALAGEADTVLCY
ncbi:MAG: DsrE family protein [Pseudomonadota bacterium]